MPCSDLALLFAITLGLASYGQCCYTTELNVAHKELRPMGFKQHHEIPVANPFSIQSVSLYIINITFTISVHLSSQYGDPKQIPTPLH